ncbi:hypothetical protein [Clostridium sp. UBA7503]|uniref:hypothetical protein n=1 Tax=Clostridium sp. UBA7503 TaxID=1946377 RepID=UPI003217BC00
MNSSTLELDVSMGKKYLFSYEYLEETRELVNGEDYRLYFVLLSDKYKMMEYYGLKNILNLICINESNGTKYNVQFDIFGSFRANNIDCINVKICNQGSLLHISYTEKGVNYLKDNFPDEYSMYCERIEACGEFWVKIHVKNLIELFLTSNLDEIVNKYKILYIGRSKQENIFDRLENHGTIQKINRDIGKRFAGKTLDIMLCDVSSKKLDKHSIEKYNTEIICSNSLGNSFELFNSIHRNEVIDISEAMLIAHFKPEYNTNLKEVKGNLKTYSKFNDVEIRSINFTLDLFWEMSKEKSILYTDNIKTETKARIIICEFKDTDIEFSYDDLEDKYY